MVTILYRQRHGYDVRIYPDDHAAPQVNEEAWSPYFAGSGMDSTYASSQENMVPRMYMYSVEKRASKSI